MPYYRVMLNGTEIRMPGQEADKDIVGFYTTRLVHAGNEDAAVQKACKSVAAQWASGSYAHTNKGQSPKLSLEWVRRTSFLDLFFFKATGHVFYPEDDNEA